MTAERGSKQGVDGSKKMVRFANVDDSRLSVILVNAPLTTQQLPRLHLGVSRAETKDPLRVTSTDQASRKF